MTKVPSETVPPRKVYALTDDGLSELREFWTMWGVLSGRINHSTTEGIGMARNWIELVTGSLAERPGLMKASGTLPLLVGCDLVVEAGTIDELGPCSSPPPSSPCRSSNPAAPPLRSPAAP